MQSLLAGRNRYHFTFKALIILLMIPLGCSNSPIESGNGGVAPVQWYRQNPFPTGDNLYDITTFRESSWIAGDGGTILYSADGGLSWRQQDAPTKKCLRAVYFRDQQMGWAVGDSGIILHTTDGGRSWREQGFQSTNCYSSIGFSGLRIGWAVGDDGSAYTTDGGQSWSASSLTGHHVAFVNVDLGFIATIYGQIRRSTDGGRNWTEIAVIPYVDDVLSITFVNERVGFAAEENPSTPFREGVVWKTEDGGMSWSQLMVVGPLYGLSHNHAGDVYLIGGNQITVSRDTGRSWVTMNVASSLERFQAIGFSSDRIGVVVGASGGIYREDAGALTWQEISRGNRVPIEDVAGLTPLHAWVVCSSGAYETVDGGLNWQKNFEVEAPKTVKFTDSLHGWITTEYDTLYVTDDGGRNWADRSVRQYYRLDDAFFVDSTAGWQFRIGLLWHTSDGGFTWQSQANLNGLDYFTVFFTDRLNGWIAGLSLPVLRSYDGGDTWVPLAGPVPQWFQRIMFTDTTNGWALGVDATMFHSVDGGRTWAPVAFDGIGGVASLSFLNSTDGWICGGRGGIYSTDDGGATWTRQETPTAQPLRGISVLDNENGWAVGYGGEILRLGRPPK